MHELRVVTLSQGTGDCTMARAVVVEGLQLGKDILAARRHSYRVVRSGVGREGFGCPFLLDASPHGLGDPRDALIHLTQNMDLHWYGPVSHGLGKGLHVA